MGWGGGVVAIFGLWFSTIRSHTSRAPSAHTPKNRDVRTHSGGVHGGGGRGCKKTSLALRPDAAARCTEGSGSRVKSQLCGVLSGDQISSKPPR